MVCPGCGLDNIQGVFACEECGMDLAGLDIPDALPMQGLKRHIMRDAIGRVGPLKPLLTNTKATLWDAIRIMKQGRHGSVLVVDPDDDDQLVGIFTERDVLTRVVRPRLDPATPVAKVMTPKPYTLEPGDPPVFAVHMCAVRGLRHLPVVDDGKVVGFLSVRHLLRFVLEEVIAGS